jgi:hypothetical protein
MKERPSFIFQDRRIDGSHSKAFGRMLEETTVEDLIKNKVCVRFVPQLSTPYQKHQRPASSFELDEMIDDDRNVLERIITGDESWRFVEDPERRNQS